MLFHILFQGGGGGVDDALLLNTNKGGGGESPQSTLSSALSHASSSSTQTRKKQQHPQTLIAAADAAPPSQQQQLPIHHHHHLLHDPRAALKPFLSATHMARGSNNNNNDYLSLFTLPPTILGQDDYRPTLKKNTRIVAFGDVHGDIRSLQTFLITAGVLDPTSTNHEPRWSGGKTMAGRYH
jgi:hypothetical protein